MIFGLQSKIYKIYWHLFKGNNLYTFEERYFTPVRQVVSHCDVFQAHYYYATHHDYIASGMVNSAGHFPFTWWFSCGEKKGDIESSAILYTYDIKCTYVGNNRSSTRTSLLRLFFYIVSWIDIRLQKYIYFAIRFSLLLVYKDILSVKISLSVPYDRIDTCRYT